LPVGSFIHKYIPQNPINATTQKKK